MAIGPGVFSESEVTLVQSLDVSRCVYVWGCGGCVSDQMRLGLSMVCSHTKPATEPSMMPTLIHTSVIDTRLQHTDTETYRGSEDRRTGHVRLTRRSRVFGGRRGANV